MRTQGHFEISPTERCAIAAHRGDVTTMQAANRVKARAAGDTEIVRQQQPPLAAADTPASPRPGPVIL